MEDTVIYRTLWNNINSVSDVAMTLSGPGTFTLFAPTNTAFAAVDEEVLSILATNIPELTSVLNYHLLPAKVLSSMVTDGLIVTTVQGSNLTFTVSGGIFVTDALRRTTCQIGVETVDIFRSNGVIHSISCVLTPTNLTRSPTTGMPSISPSNTPTTATPTILTVSPTLLPTKSPTLAILVPTNTPSLSPPVNANKYGKRRERVNTVQKMTEPIFIIITIVISGSYFVLFTTGYIHARITQNDVFRGFSIISAGIYTYDLFTDIFLGYEIYQVRTFFGDTTLLIIFIASILTIIIPVTVTVGQLIISTQKWRDTNISENSTELASWILFHGPKLYALTFATGNAFSAVALCNSNLFEIPLFSMPLTSDQLLKFKNLRSYSSVLLEVSLYPVLYIYIYGYKHRIYLKLEYN